MSWADVIGGMGVMNLGSAIVPIVRLVVNDLTEAQI